MSKKWPIHLDRSSYAAGILDALARFRLRRTHDNRAYAAVMEMKTSNRNHVQSVMSVFGGRSTPTGWIVPARDQLNVAAKILPYLRDETNIDTVSRIIQFRIVDINTEKTKSFRNSLVKETDPK